MLNAAYQPTSSLCVVSVEEFNNEGALHPARGTHPVTAMEVEQDASTSQTCNRTLFCMQPALAWPMPRLVLRERPLCNILTAFRPRVQCA